MLQNNKLISEELWKMDLFRDPIEFREPSVPLAVAGIDSHLRRLRNIPSTSDDTEHAVIEGLKSVKPWMDEAFSSLSACAGFSHEVRLAASTERISRAFSGGLQSGNRSRWLQRLQAELPGDLSEFLPGDDAPIDELSTGLEFVVLILKDRAIRKHNTLKKKYLKKLYEVVDTALNFNSTTDTIRLVPVIDWIKQELEKDGCREQTYVDVGCAMAAGAPGLIKASELLGDLCTVFHGTDIVAPSRELSRKLLLEQGVGVYRSNPVTRPLPRRYDVILLANVHRHMTREIQEKLLVNLLHSLNESGSLFVNWRFSSESSPSVRLLRRKECLEIVGTHNAL